MQNFSKKILLFTTLYSFIYCPDAPKKRSLDVAFQTPVTIIKDSLDELVLDGIKHISENGEKFNARAGSGQQAYEVSYILKNPRRRLHLIRKKQALKYFSRELLAYFNGSLKVNEGLSQASTFWKTLANQNGEICSNYGYYVFHQRIPEAGNITQYEWVIRNLEQNLDSRKAFININQPMHKTFSNKDFPCTLGMQFFVKNNHLCCTVSSRSTDVYTGLPYDMGFFSFVTELVFKDLLERLPDSGLQLGYVIMKTNFTQIYDKTRTQALDLLTTSVENEFEENPASDMMPEIENAQETLKDIYEKTSKTETLKWIYKNAELPNQQ